MSDFSSVCHVHKCLLYAQLIKQIRNNVIADLRIDKRSYLPNHDDRQCNSFLYTDILMVRNDIEDYMILTLLASAISTAQRSRYSTVATADPVTAVTHCTYTSLLLNLGAEDHFLSLPRDVHDILQTCRLSQKSKC